MAADLIHALKNQCCAAERCRIDDHEIEIQHAYSNANGGGVIGRIGGGNTNMGGYGQGVN